MQKLSSKQTVSRAQRASAVAKTSRQASRVSVVVRAQHTESADPSLNRRTLLGASLSIAGASALPLALAPPAEASKILSSDWELVDLPVPNEVVMLDIGFTGDNADHGFLLGTRQTLLETLDGGKTWEKRIIESARDEGFNYRFTSISFSGNEGWIVGKPAILLHTADGGTNWERIPLSNKLPGAPLLISAVPGKAGQAEMTTDQGAIYVTSNTAYTWTAAVEETVDATLNRTVASGINGASYYEGSFSQVRRNPSGEYVAVSSRGNFFMTWLPGQSYWQPHNRPTARRLQNMGWTPENSLWMSTRGGDVLLSPDLGVSENFENVKLAARGFGILDVGYVDGTKLAYACGGSGTLFKSEDSGKSWKRDKSADDVGGNLYAIKFFDPKHGFVLGNNGILMRYIGKA